MITRFNKKFTKIDNTIPESLETTLYIGDQYAGDECFEIYKIKNKKILYVNDSGCKLLIFNKSFIPIINQL